MQSDEKFIAAISSSTDDKTRIEERYQKINELIQKVLRK